MSMNSRRPANLEEIEPITAPSQCPTCRSKDVTTTSKAVSASTYWRCTACGDVWNVQRRRDAGRYSYPSQWGR